MAIWERSGSFILRDAIHHVLAWAKTPSFAIGRLTNRRKCDNLQECRA